MDDANEICKDCLRYKRFGKGCYVHWDRKKECSLRITREEEWQIPVSFIH